MPVADDGGAARPLGTHRGEQRDRVDFEVARRIGGDVPRDAGAVDPVERAEQQTARLMRRGVVRSAVD